ncbi:HAD-IA family hydrolase [Actinophytocola sp.]|uniref:HAD family hydrolase n=1 Tax=Actinophytocola sp. TaxID=1872138 RepID=UPI002ED313A7
MIHGVLFDFSGTLFHFEPGPGWPSEVADDGARDRLTALLTAPTMPVEQLPPDLVDAWERRDLDPDVNRTVYLALLAANDIGLTDAETEAVYTGLTAPEAWRPYPDTVDVLRELRAADVPVAVVSNISWDIRDIFRRHGVEELVTEFVLSFEEGVVKPDPKIFTLACQRIGVAPGNALMIGDSPENDGGAAAIGSATAIVEPLATEARPSALREALADLL